MLAEARLFDVLLKSAVVLKKSPLMFCKRVCFGTLILASTVNTAVARLNEASLRYVPVNEHSASRARPVAESGCSE